MKDMGLFDNAGIIIGKYKGKLLRFAGAQFVSLAAATRGGKGIGMVLPNLLDWTESLVVQDIKDECFRISSGFRQKILKQKVYRFAPFERNTHCFNPLACIDMTDRARAELDLKNQATGLYPLVGDPDKDFWTAQCQNLFIALAFLLWDMRQYYMTDMELTYANLLRLHSGVDSTDENGEVEHIDFARHAQLCIDSKITHPMTTDKLKIYLKSCESSKTQSNIDASFINPLMIFQNEIVEKATSHSDFDLRQLRRQKMTIYFHISPQDLILAPQVANLFFNMAMLCNTDELPEVNPELKHQVLFLMDEFTAMGMLSVINKAVGFIAGYGLRLLLIYQSQGQLRAEKPHGYGKEGAKNILDNIHCKVLYAPASQDEAEEYSKVLGNRTADKFSHSHGKSKSLSVTDVARPLLYPQEFKLIGEFKEVVVLNNCKPIMCDKAVYYNDPYFIDKLKTVSPKLRALGNKLPNKAQLEEAMFSGELSAK
ncbi:type IV secretory system conjugative DNA transfer family protein [Aggregatibacter actinomycetemcomitans]|nr:type IV secretory system conjugative DNA transfer family protein [Aggregatibacter actinomycetemcomitans]MBN6087881.1 type IV secretory system conjugative DNA transfer family protein [Aggregatibacter actinomycetemcomitans]